MKLKSIAFLVGLLALSRPGLAVPWLHEVFYDAEGADAAHVFTEIGGNPGTSLDGYQLVGIDGGSGLVYRQIDLSGALIPEDGLLVIATSRAVGAVLSVRDFIADVDWQNGPEAIQIWNALGEVVDALQYGDAGALHLGEGAFAPDPLSGFALARDLFGTDTGDNHVDFHVATPTPGEGLTIAPAPVPVPVPEPSPWTAVAFGLLFTGGAAWERRPGKESQEALEALRARGRRHSC